MRLHPLLFALLPLLGLSLPATPAMPGAGPSVVPAFPTADTLSIQIVPEHLELRAGGEARLQIQVLGPEGASLEGRTVRWFSGDEAVASVDVDGTVRALGEGRTEIVAAVDGQYVAFASMVVLPPPPTELEGSLPSPALYVGTSAPLTLRARDPSGDMVEPGEVVFRSRDPSVATVDPTGRVHARSPGSTEVIAAAGPAETAVSIQVEADPGLELDLVGTALEGRTGDVLRFRVDSRRADGGSPPELHPDWTVSGMGAHIQAEGPEGVFVAQEPGRYRVTALVGEERARSVVVEVTPREHDARLVRVGRGPLGGHHSGDKWVFEGVDGRDYVLIGTFMYDWLKVWDVTEPSNPILTDSVQMDARRINDVKVHESRRLAVATREGASDRRNGIVILDLSEPAHPTVMAEYTETLTGGVHNVWPHGDLVYAVHNGTSDMHIIDISDPANPREVGRWGLDKEQKSLHDAIVQDGYAYLSYWHDGLVMLDVGAGTHGGTPTEPAFVSRFSYPAGHTHTAWRHGRYLFVGDEIFPSDWDPTRPIEARGYIHVLDMEDPENPVEVARYEVPEAGVHNFWPEDDLLYVGYYQAGLRVLDISGELRGDLYRQGREMAVLKTTDEDTMVPNWPMTWGAQPFKGNIFASDLNSGLWITRLIRGPVIF